MAIKPSRRETTHERIVEVAARALRRNGYAGVGVADVMKQAGLTHGGFYAHFPSRDALLAEALVQAGRDSTALMGRRISQRQARGQSALRALVESYLSDTHLRGIEAGCVVAALGSEMHRQTPELLGPSAERVRALIAMVQQALPAHGTQQQAMVIASTMVGALQLARTLGDNVQGNALLTATRNALLTQYDTA
jgi:AcrR family transcriptional regulator